MAVKIGHASIDENGKAKGGSAGDQTKKEVCTRNWYNKPWTSVIRPNDSSVAEKIATAMEQACANDNIGYDQSQRTTLYTKAQEANWDISKITSKCECDCSSLVAVCVNAAGISVSKDIYTGNEKTSLANTGAFTVLTETKYTSKADYLKRGDILLGSGHTAVVLGSGTSASTDTATTQKKEDTATIHYSVRLPLLKEGNVRESVKALQILLIGYGYSCGSYGVDGDFGLDTKKAVLAYQEANGLEVDGKVGPKTWAKLLGVSA